MIAAPDRSSIAGETTSGILAFLTCSRNQRRVKGTSINSSPDPLDILDVSSHNEENDDI